MNYLKLYFISIAIMICNMGLYAQTKAEKQEIQSVKLTINKLFDGMREGDSAKVASTFSRQVTMYTSLTTKNGEQVVKKGNLNAFLHAIGTPHDAIWDEKTMNTTISIEGSIAQVWTDYTFYIGSKFSHCGVDAFHLIKENGNDWKIVHLMDTRRTEACEISDQ